MDNAVSLKEHFDALFAALEKRNDQRFRDQQEAVKAALASAERAVEKAEVNAEKWRVNANEWRGAMNDRERALMPRSEAEKSTAANSDKIASLESRFSQEIADIRAAQSESAGDKKGRISQQQLFLALPAVLLTLMMIAGTIVAIAYAIRR
jgi:hypothetical protein